MGYLSLEVGDVFKCIKVDEPGGFEPVLVLGETTNQYMVMWTSVGSSRPFVMFYDKTALRQEDYEVYGPNTSW